MSRNCDDHLFPTGNQKFPIQVWRDLFATHPIKMNDYGKGGDCNGNATQGNNQYKLILMGKVEIVTEMLRREMFNIISGKDGDNFGQEKIEKLYWWLSTLLMGADEPGRSVNWQNITFVPSVDQEKTSITGILTMSSSVGSRNVVSISDILGIMLDADWLQTWNELYETVVQQAMGQPT